MRVTLELCSGEAENLAVFLLSFAADIPKAAAFAVAIIAFVKALRSMPSKARLHREKVFSWRCTKRYVTEFQYRHWHSRVLWEYSSQEDVLPSPPWVLHLLLSLVEIGEPSELIWMDKLQGRLRSQRHLERPGSPSDRWGYL